MANRLAAGRPAAMTDLKTPPLNDDTLGAEIVSSAGRTDRVLVVAGEAASQRLITSRLNSAGYWVDAVASADDARTACAQRSPDLVILDLDVQRAGGLPLLKELKQRWPDLLIIAIANLLGVDKGVRATQFGAFSYLVKPVEKAELLDHVKRAIGVSAAAPQEHDWRADLVARSLLREERIRQFNEAATSDIHLLLTGENSVGRELVARAIHAASSRRDKPFIVMRCGTGTAGEFWPDPDMFSRSILKALSSAQGGTLVIDEIDNLPQPAQQALAAAVGDVRVIATSQFDSRELVGSGRLRNDLHTLIGRQPLATPPLGRRREDIPLLIGSFLEQATEPGTDRVLYTEKDVAALVATNWPANIRELFTLVCHNTALASEGTLPAGSEPKDSSFDEAREVFARQYLSETLRMTEGNVSESARLAKRNRTDFYKLMAKYRLSPNDFKAVQVQP